MTPNTWHCNKHDQKNTRYSTNTTTQKQILYIPDLYRFLRTYSCPFKCCCLGPSTICAHIGWATLQFPFEVPHTTIRLSILTASVVGSLYYGMSPPGNERTSPRTKRAMFVYFGKVHGLQTPNSIQLFCDIFVSVFGMLVKIPMFGTKRKRKRL